MACRLNAIIIKCSSLTSKTTHKMLDQGGEKKGIHCQGEEKTQVCNQVDQEEDSPIFPCAPTKVSPLGVLACRNVRTSPTPIQ